MTDPVSGEPTTPIPAGWRREQHVTGPVCGVPCPEHPDETCLLKPGHPETISHESTSYYYRLPPTQIEAKTDAAEPAGVDLLEALNPPGSPMADLLDHFGVTGDYVIQPLDGAALADAGHDLGATTNDCPACAAEADALTAGAPTPLGPLLVEGLTIWGTWGGAQIRTEAEFLTPLPDPWIEGESALPETGPPVAILMIGFRDDAPRNDRETGAPYRLTADDARQLRDLLNIATARSLL